MVSLTFAGIKGCLTTRWLLRDQDTPCFYGNWRSVCVCVCVGGGGWAKCPLLPTWTGSDEQQFYYFEGQLLLETKYNIYNYYFLICKNCTDLITCFSGGREALEQSHTWASIRLYWTLWPLNTMCVAEPYYCISPRQFHCSATLGRQNMAAQWLHCCVNDTESEQFTGWRIPQNRRGVYLLMTHVPLIY